MAQLRDKNIWNDDHNVGLDSWKYVFTRGARRKIGQKIASIVHVSHNIYCIH